jgi:hypothetical protein
LTADVPRGQRFSHVYVARGEPTQDSPRMRRRIASLIGAIRDLYSDTDFEHVVEEKLGIASPRSSSDVWTGLLAKWELFDVLDLATLAYRFLEAKRSRGMHDPRSPERWIEGVREIFAEENVHYTVDDRGGVHFKYDEEFARNTAAAVAALQSPRYANARDNYEKSLAALSGGAPDFKTAIRANFAAVEVVFKLLLPSSPRLTASDADALGPLVQKALAGDAAAQSASAKMLSAFKDWVNVAHVYRHEQGQEEPTQPPIALAISILSVGSTYLRWLAETDSALQNAG